MKLHQTIVPVPLYFIFEVGETVKAILILVYFILILQQLTHYFNQEFYIKTNILNALRIYITIIKVRNNICICYLGT